MAENLEQLLANPLLVVRGVHTSEVDPELAYVLTELAARARRREDVFERLREGSEWQRGVIDRHASKIEKDEMAAHQVHPIVDRESSDTPVGYIGELRTKITVKDIASVGDLVSDLSLGDMSQVLSVVWAVRPTSPVYRANRIAAVHDALSRARDYCAAVGSQITALVAVTETDRQNKADPVSAARLAGGQGSALFDFRPIAQTIRAEVEARFTMLPPKFG